MQEKLRKYIYPYQDAITVYLTFISIFYIYLITHWSHFCIKTTILDKIKIQIFKVKVYEWSACFSKMGGNINNISVGHFKEEKLFNQKLLFTNFLSFFVYIYLYSFGKEIVNQDEGGDIKNFYFAFPNITYCFFFVFFQV